MVKLFREFGRKLLNNKKVLSIVLAGSMLFNIGCAHIADGVATAILAPAIAVTMGPKALTEKYGSGEPTRPADDMQRNSPLMQELQKR